MFKFFNIIGVLVSFCLTFFVFVFVIRVANNKDAFIGTNDIAVFFQHTDFYKPLKDMITHLKSEFDDLTWEMGVGVTKFTNISFITPEYVAINNPADFFVNIGKWFSSLWNCFGQIFDMIGQVFSIIREGLFIVATPTICLGYIFYWILHIFGIFGNFLVFIVT